MLICCFIPYDGGDYPEHCGKCALFGDIAMGLAVQVFHRNLEPRVSCSATGQEKGGNAGRSNTYNDLSVASKLY